MSTNNGSRQFEPPRIVQVSSVSLVDPRCHGSVLFYAISTVQASISSDYRERFDRLCGLLLTDVCPLDDSKRLFLIEHSTLERRPIDPCQMANVPASQANSQQRRLPIVKQEVKREYEHSYTGDTCEGVWADDRKLGELLPTFHGNVPTSRDGVDDDDYKIVPMQIDADRVQTSGGED